MDPRSSFSKSNSARGRIAQVLAQARASLNEPTRPVTPQMLDQRTSVPFSLEALPQGGKVSKTKKRTDKYTDKRRSSDDDQYSIQYQEIQPEFSSAVVYQQDDVLDNFAPVQDEIEDEQLPLEVKRKDKPSWTLSKVINDFVNELKARGEGNFEDVIIAIEDSTKRLKSASVDVSANRLLTTQACLSELISYVNRSMHHVPWIYQLNSAILRFLVASAALEDHSVSTKSMVMQNMEALTEFIFKLKSESNGKIFSSIEEMDASAASTADQADTVLLLPVLVDCLQFLLFRLNALFKAISTSSRAKRDEEIEISTDDTLCSVFNAASYCLATIRALSTNHETDRKRLLHAKGLDVIIQMMTFYDTFAKIVRRMRVVRSSQSNKQTIANKDEEDDDDDDYDEQLLSIPVSPLVQVVGVIRNVSLDKVGRAQMTDTPLCRMMCKFLNTYVEYAEVVINIARVLAKLSLYETFRSQISNGPRDNRHEYMSYLVNVLRKESDRCLKIMNDERKLDAEGQEAYEEEEMEVWPAWYTWPLISRMAFTLGNFTTTNEANRHLIGSTLGGAESILLLFQVSVSTQMRIHELKKQKEAQKIASTSVFSFAQGLLGGGDINPYESLDGPKKSGDVEGTTDDANVDASSELELRDAIIKLVRLVANLSIDYDVGITMGSDRENLQSLLDLLTISDASVEHEEMVLNVVAALTNLTFYSCQYIDMKMSEEDNTGGTGVATVSNTATHKFVARLDRTLIAIAQRVADGLFHENTEIVLETARVFGNLTRRSSVVQLLFRKRIDEALLMLLAHINTDVISAVAGVFVNISAYAEGRMLLLQREDPYFVPHVSGMLRRLTLKDIPIAILLTQILYNVITSTDYEEAVKMNREHRVPPNLFGTLEEWIELVEDAVDQEQQQQEHKSSEGKDAEHASSRRHKHTRESQYNAQFIQVAKALSEHIATMGSVSL